MTQLYLSRVYLDSPRKQLFRAAVRRALALIAILASPALAQSVDMVLGEPEVVFQLRVPARSLNRMLEPPRAVHELSDGRVIILINRRLYLGDPRDGSTSALPDTVGGILSLAGDTVVQVRRNQWAFRVADRLVGVLPSTNPIVAYLRDNTIDPVGIDHIGNVYIETMDARFKDSMAVYRANRQSGDRALVARLGIPPMLRGGVCPNLERAAYFSDGWIGIVRSGAYRVDWRAADGSWRFGAPIRRDVVRPSPAEQTAYLKWEGEDRRRIAPSVAEKDIEWPREMCAWHASFPPMALPDGRILVPRVPTSVEPATRYDIIDREGRLARRVRIPADQSIVGFGIRSIYVLTTRDSVQQFSRYRFP